MAAPTLQKTWQFKVNQDLNTLSNWITDRQQLLRTIKNSLIDGVTFTTPWTVRGSSNGVTAGMDATDRWAADSDVVWNSATSAHSWIVLRQSGLGTNIDLLISCSTQNQGNNPLYLTVLVAVDGVGFTGGSTTADPTATTTLKTMLQPTFASPSQDGLGHWMRGNDTTSFNCALHVLMSNDGQCTRVGVFVGGLPVLWLIIDRVRNPVTSLTLPIFACWIADYTLSGVRIIDAPLWLDVMGTASPTYTETYPWRAGSMYHSGDFNVVFTTERVGSPTLPLEGAIPERLCKNDALDSYKYALTGIGIYSAASGKVGRHGAVYDLWFGDNCAPVGRGYPSDTAPNFVHWRHIVVPWNGTTMLTN
jgi:hypothetical protein